MDTCTIFFVDNNIIDFSHIINIHVFLMKSHDNVWIY